MVNKEIPYNSLVTSHHRNKSSQTNRTYTHTHMRARARVVHIRYTHIYIRSKIYKKKKKYDSKVDQSSESTRGLYQEAGKVNDKSITQKRVVCLEDRKRFYNDDNGGKYSNVRQTKSILGYTATCVWFWLHFDHKHQ